MLFSSSNILIFCKSLIDKVPKYICEIKIIKNNIVFVINSKNLYNFVFFLKNHILVNYNILIDITAVDMPTKRERFQLFYSLISTIYNTRLIIQIFVKELETVNSLIKIYSSSNWLEREVWDLFGVFFSNHVDLRRILTDYGFKGFPLRKDFPLSGFLELQYDEENKIISYFPLEFSQEYRLFDLQSPWNILK